MSDEIEQAVRDHYHTHSLSEARVDAILEFCEPAREVSRWRRLAFVGFGSAAAAAAVLLVVVTNRSDDAPTSSAKREIVGWIPASPAPAPVAAPRPPGRLQLIAIRIHADPCGRCKKIAPVFADLQDRFNNDHVLFLTFDLTSNGSRHQAELLSRTFGIEELYKKHRYTGVIVLATPDGQVHEIVDSEAGLATAMESMSRVLGSG